MSEGSASELIKEFRGALAAGELTEDVVVDYEISGGLPGEDVPDLGRTAGIPARVRLAGDGRLTVPDQPAVQLDPSETVRLLEQVASSLDGLVPRAQARFLPDSTVGSLTIAVHGGEATLYFLADERQRWGQEDRVPPGAGAADAMRPLREMSRRLEAQRRGGQ